MNIISDPMSGGRDWKAWMQGIYHYPLICNKNRITFSDLGRSRLGNILRSVLSGAI